MQGQVHGSILQPARVPTPQPQCQSASPATEIPKNANQLLSSLEEKASVNHTLAYNIRARLRGEEFTDSCIPRPSGTMERLALLESDGDVLLNLLNEIGNILG